MSKGVGNSLNVVEGSGHRTSAPVVDPMNLPMFGQQVAFGWYYGTVRVNSRLSLGALHSRLMRLSKELERLRGGAPAQVLDLFAGCGGLALGFAVEGVRSVGAVQIDPFAIRSYALNLHNGSKPRDITHGLGMRAI